ncbi:type II toxin-antitoxin system RelE/ParE family toxin [bacterium]|nr:type II toxin-antitoxin system RelE/ParE family toxin [bacterium]
MSTNNYELKITTKASEDLNEIYSYIAGEISNEIAALNLMDEIEKNILRLKEFPFSCSYVEDIILKDKGYRKLIVKNYITFYIVNDKDKKVVIMRVLYGRQNYQSII